MKRKTSRHTDAADLVGLARVGMLIGAMIAFAGLLQGNTVLRSMAEVYGVTPSLTGPQTVFVGVLLLGASVAMCLRGRRRDRD
jgi:hypothetical protein